MIFGRFSVNNFVIPFYYLFPAPLVGSARNILAVFISVTVARNKFGNISVRRIFIKRAHLGANIAAPNGIIPFEGCFFGKIKLFFLLCDSR